MAKRRRKLDLSQLQKQPPENLRLASLARGSVEGHAYRYTMILPLLSETGEEVFSVEQHVPLITQLLDRRFGGCTVTTPTPHPPLRGTWLPDDAADSVADQHMALQVYARPIEAADRFFQYLKTRLKAVGRQEEIVIERADVWLLSSARPPRG